MSKNKVKKTETQNARDNLKAYLLDNWLNIAVNIFKWEGLPEGVESTRIEEYLYNNGMCVWVDDPELGYLTLPIAERYGLNVYGDPIRWRAVGYGYNKPYNIENSVLIRNNRTRTPIRPVIEFYTDMLMNTDFTILLNLNAQKTPFIFSGSENELLTLKNLWQQLYGCEPVIYKDNKLSENAFKVADTQVPYIADKLMDLYADYENRIYTFLGIKNNNISKRERLIVDEVNANNEQINGNLDAKFTARKLACEAINKMFGLNCTVSINSNVKEDTDDASEDDKPKEEGNKNE